MESNGLASAASPPKGLAEWPSWPRAWALVASLATRRSNSSFVGPPSSSASASSSSVKGWRSGSFSFSAGTKTASWGYDAADQYDHAANQAAVLEDVPSGALLFDVAKDDSLTELGNTIVESHIAWEYAVLDYKAANQAEIKKMLGSIAGFTKFLMKREIDVTVCIVVDHDAAASDGIQETICAWGAGPRLIVVKNPRIADNEGKPFDWYDGALGSVGPMSPAEAVKVAGGVEVDMPLFLGGGALMAKAYDSHQPLSALNLSPVDESRAQGFLDDFGTAFFDALENAMARPGVSAAAIKQIKAAMASNTQGAGK